MTQKLSHQTNIKLKKSKIAYLELQKKMKLLNLRPLLNILKKVAL